MPSLDRDIVIFQKATDEDLQGILDLQHQNFIDNLTDQERMDGFLSVKLPNNNLRP